MLMIAKIVKLILMIGITKSDIFFLLVMLNLLPISEITIHITAKPRKGL
jgi:hypothetical protein